MSLGSGPPPPLLGGFNGRVAPEADRRRLYAAIELVREVAQNAERYPRCHREFMNRCSAGTPHSLRAMFDKAKLWKADDPDALAFTWPHTDDIAYTQSGYESGERRLAATLVHELMHNCGITGDELHHLADVAGLYCIGPANQISLAAGPVTNADLPWLLYSYRRLLADVGSGQIQLIAGADLNVMSLFALADPSQTTEFGSLMLGARLRGFHAPNTSPTEALGGERFGGMTASLGVGTSLGRFRVRHAGPELSAGFVVTAGVGAEFYLPVGVNAVPLSVEAMYRLVQPLNPEAERMHGWLLSAGFHF